MTILLIDGRSGSGKTELATALVAETGAEIVRLDNIYLGWDGLEAGSAAVPQIIGERRWQRWDWRSNSLAEWHEIDPSAPLIIEGCGALSKANRALADYGLWVSFPDAARKKRALDRDGDMFAPHWDVWAVQEGAFIARENPASLADEIVDGADVTLHIDRWRRLLNTARVER